MGAPAYEGVAEKPLRSSLSSMSAAHSFMPHPSCGVLSRSPALQNQTVRMAKLRRW